jgi:hypothetical protein
MSSSYYRTKDLYYAAFLQVAGVPFKGALREGPQVYFLFEDLGEGSVPYLKKSYFSGTGKVSAMSFVQAIRAMKTLIHTT